MSDDDDYVLHDVALYYLTLLYDILYLIVLMCIASGTLHNSTRLKGFWFDDIPCTKMTTLNLVFLRTISPLFGFTLIFIILSIPLHLVPASNWIEVD